MLMETPGDFQKSATLTNHKTAQNYIFKFENYSNVHFFRSISFARVIYLIDNTTLSIFLVSFR